jgi:hypothetical protein
MNLEFCEYEEAVTAALASGQWSEELVQHLTACRQCADLRLVSQYLATAAPPTREQTTHLPAPGLIWWRAQLAERQALAARAVAAIEVMQKVALAVALVAVVTCAIFTKPVELSTLLLGAGLAGGSAAVLYGWVRGRI